MSCIYHYKDQGNGIRLTVQEPCLGQKTCMPIFAHFCLCPSGKNPVTMGMNGDPQSCRVLQKQHQQSSHSCFLDLVVVTVKVLNLQSYKFQFITKNNKNNYQILLQILNPLSLQKHNCRPMVVNKILQFTIHIE